MFDAERGSDDTFVKYQLLYSTAFCQIIEAIGIIINPINQNR